MKKLSILVLILVLLVSTAMSEGVAATGRPRLEGDGYDTPEEAVLAYLDAMNNADVYGMLATFAHESYAEHFDPDLYIQRTNAIWPMGMANMTPITDTYSADLVLYSRYSNIASNLLTQYTQYTDPLYGETRAPMNQEAIDTHRQMYEQSFLHDMQGHVTFVEWIDPALITHGTFIQPVNRCNIARQYAFAGADDLANMVAHFQINGTDVLQFMTCARYEGRWYNLLFHGNAASLIGLGQDTIGLIPLYDSEIKEDLNYTPDLLYYALLAGRELYASSPLGGTRWQLISLNQQNIELKPSPEDALQSDCGLWCELHFYSVGGATITMTAGSALRSRLGMDYRSTISGTAWSESEGVLQFSELYIPSRYGYDYSSEITSAFYDGDTLTIRLQDGTVAVFQQFE